MSLILLNLLAGREPSYTSYLHRPWLIRLLSLARLEKMQRTRRSGTIARMDSAAATLKVTADSGRSVRLQSIPLYGYLIQPHPMQGGNEMYTDIRAC